MAMPLRALLLVSVLGWASLATAQTSSRRLCPPTGITRPEIIEPADDVWPANRALVVAAASLAAVRLVGPDGEVPLVAAAGAGPRGALLFRDVPLARGQRYELEVNAPPETLPGRTRHAFTVSDELDDRPPHFEGVVALMVEREEADACGAAGWVAKLGFALPSEPAAVEVDVTAGSVRRGAALSSLGDGRGRSGELWVDLGRDRPGTVCVTMSATDLAGHVAEGRGACCWSAGGGARGACSNEGVDRARALAAPDGGCSFGGAPPSAPLALVGLAVIQVWRRARRRR